MKKTSFYLQLKQVLALMLCFVMLPFSYAAAAEDDATLKSLSFNELVWLDFASDIYDYTAVFPYNHLTGKYVVPSVSYEKNNEAANVDVYVPEGIENGYAGTPIKITVTAEDNITKNEYTISPIFAGQNVYGNGSFEQGTEGWGARTCSFEIVDTGAAHGDKALKVSGNSSIRYWDPVGINKFTPVPNKTYISSYQLKLAPDAEVSAYTDTSYVEWISADKLGGSVQYLNENNEAVTTSTVVTGDWKRLMAVFNVTNDRSGASSENFLNHHPLNWAANRPPYLVDDYYASELVAVKAEIVDSMENEELVLEQSADGAASLALDVKLLNQLGNKAGVYGNVDVSFKLKDEAEGISVSGNTVTVMPEATPKNYEIVAEITPKWIGAAQQKIIAKTTLSVKAPVDRSAAELYDIKVGELSVTDFSPKKSDYNVLIPYTYTPNNFTAYEIPEITYIKKDEGAIVTVTKEGAANGGTVTIDVVNGEMSKTYKLHLKTCGVNLFEDGGFETEDTWTKSHANSISYTAENPGAGNKAIAVDGDNSYTTSIAPKNPNQTIVGRTYLTHGMVRISEESEAKGVYHNYGDMNTTSVNANEQGYFYTESGERHETNSFTGTTEWMHTYGTYTPKASTSARWGYATGKDHTLYFADEYYFGDLTVNSIKYTGETEAYIPETAGGKIEVPLEAKMFNAFGNTIGLENEKIVYSAAYDYNGITVLGDKLYVTSDASEGDVIIRMTINPTFGSVQEKITSTAVVSVKTNAADAKIPKARYVELSRDKNALGYVLNASYYYYHALGTEEGASSVKWLYSDTANGAYAEIPNVVGLTYNVQAEYRDKFICFEVTPITKDGVAGSTVRSNIISKPEAPSAEMVAINGIGAVGETLTGTYEYRDSNGDEEGQTTFRWLTSDSENGSFTPISGATGTTYVITKNDVKKYIKFEVTPKSTIEPETGKAYLSDARICATVPEIHELEIVKNSGDVYSVSYKYYHPLEIAEGKTRVEWYLDDRYLGEENIVTAEASKSKTLTVKVTPVAVKEPFEGETAVLGITISGKSTSVGNSSGGSRGGGGKASSFVVPVPEKVQEQETKTPEVVKHWAADGIEFALQKGIMQNVSQDDFGGSELVTRADFVLYTIRAIGEQDTAYNFEFKDVGGTDYFAGALQKAVNLGIISKDEYFYPERNVSREEICKILVTAVGLGAVDNADLTRFTDNENIAEWAKGFVAQANAIGLLKGVSETEFMPKGMVTREQTAVIIKRLYDYKNGGSVQ